MLSWINHSLSPEIYNSVLWFDNCFLLWKDLKHRYHQGDIFRSTLLQEELYSIKQGDLSVTTYFTKLKSVWEELDSYLPIPDCSCNPICNCGLEIVCDYRHKEYVIRFLRGLNDQYSNVRSQVMLMKPLPNIESTFSLLTEQERQFAFPIQEAITLFNSATSTTSSTVCHSYTHFSISELWHSRLGHPSFDKVHVIKKLDPTVECLNIHTSCDVCHYAKMKKLSFPSSTNTSYSAYDLIHVDIWGPFGMPSILGHKYFLTIVDDFSRYTRFFCMKTKAETRPTLITFIKLIQTQFHKTVKTIRSDNGPEFNITDFFNKNGIHHQTSCVETPQQNVVVERKHQSILNIARSLLFQSHLPICFWNYAITHDVFILNRLPTTTLKNLTPFEALNNQVPNYSELRVFDSLCFATTLSAHRSKFDKRTRKCIFVGYQRGTKGYLLYDLHNREIFLSRHVEFHEHIFPFSMPQSPPISSSSSPSSPLPNWDFFDTPYSILTPVEPSSTSQSPPSISVHPPLSKNIYVSESHVSLPIPLNSRPSGS